MMDTSGQGLMGNTERPVHSDIDSTMKGDPELVPNPPGDALQEPCSTADTQESAADQSNNHHPLELVLTRGCTPPYPQ